MVLIIEWKCILWIIYRQLIGLLPSQMSVFSTGNVFSINRQSQEGNTVCAYLFGFYSQTQPVAYAHLIAVRKDYRKLGLGRKLYEHFIKCAREKHCLNVKATTRPINLDSISFQKKSGWNWPETVLLTAYLLFTIMRGLENIELFSWKIFRADPKRDGENEIIRSHEVSYYAI